MLHNEARKLILEGYDLAYKNIPFPKQYTILSNKWGAVQNRAGKAFCVKNRISGSDRCRG